MTPLTTAGHPFKIVIVGGGVAGLEAALTLNELAGDLVAITILAPESEYVYRPMSVVEPFAYSPAPRYQLSDLAGLAGATHKAAALRWLEPERRIVHTDHHEKIAYDAVLLAHGAKQYASLANTITLDPARIDEQLHGIIQDIEVEAVKSLAFIVPPTGGYWPLPAYELALMTARRAYDMNVSPQITIVTPEHTPLEIFGEAASLEVSKLLQEASIDIIPGAKAHVHAPGRIDMYALDRHLHADAVVALPELLGASVPGVPATGLHSFIATDPHGQVLKLDNVFAAGDITSYPVKQGAIAAQQAVCVAHSLASLAGAPTTPKPFLPTIHGVLIGPHPALYMRARLAGGRPYTSEVSTTPLWEPGDKIHAPHLTEALTRCSPVAKVSRDEAAERAASMITTRT